VTLTVLSSYRSGRSFSSAIRTPRAAQPAANSETKATAAHKRDSFNMIITKAGLDASAPSLPEKNGRGRNREVIAGMRRCQRLPEVTHPGESAATAVR
jgi:hypothetical protein